MEASSSAKTIDGLLPRAGARAVLNDKCGKPQCQKMVKRADPSTCPGRGALLFSPSLLFPLPLAGEGQGGGSHEHRRQPFPHPIPPPQAGEGAGRAQGERAFQFFKQPRRPSLRPTCPGRGAASFTLRRRAGTPSEFHLLDSWTPDQQRIASRCAASGARSHGSAISPRDAPEVCEEISFNPPFGGRRECRAHDAPAASHAK